MTSVSQALQAFSATARNAESRHYFGDVLDYDLSADDEAGNDNHIVRSPIVGTSLLGEVGQPEVVVFEFVHVGKSRHVQIRHDGRFYEWNVHFLEAPAFFVSPLRERSKHGLAYQSIHNDVSVSKYYASVNDRTEASSEGEKTVNPATKDTPHSATVTS